MRKSFVYECNSFYLSCNWTLQHCSLYKISLKALFPERQFAINDKNIEPNCSYQFMFFLANILDPNFCVRRECHTYSVVQLLRMFREQFHNALDFLNSSTIYVEEGLMFYLCARERVRESMQRQCLEKNMQFKNKYFQNRIQIVENERNIHHSAYRPIC